MTTSRKVPKPVLAPADVKPKRQAKSRRPRGPLVASHPAGARPRTAAEIVAEVKARQEELNARAAHVEEIDRMNSAMKAEEVARREAETEATLLQLRQLGLLPNPDDDMFIGAEANIADIDHYDMRNAACGLVEMLAGRYLDAVAEHRRTQQVQAARVRQGENSRARLELALRWIYETHRDDEVLVKVIDHVFSENGRGSVLESPIAGRGDNGYLC